jgi:hypothetical protein
MRIVLDIGRLVLDGVPVTAAEADRVRRAVEGELSRLLGAGPLPPRFSAGGAVPSLVAPPLERPAGRPPEAFGTDIAHAVHAALVGTRSGNGDAATAGKRREQRT